MLMSALIVVSLLSIWFYSGWLILGFARIEDATMRGLLAPAVGMAVVTLVTTTSSLAGLPIKQSMWIIILMLGGSLFFVRRVTWSGLRGVAGLNLLILVLNLCTVGIGLIIFGTSWHGLINGDAATNSLAAQYFITHPFFAVPSIQSIISGIDYSPLSSVLYVSGGHRFGDVMLLGFSASLFNLNPDEVYMAHALAICCSLIAAAALLIYQRGAPAWKLIVAIVLLTLSPLGAYTYLNQLISQSGGLSLLLTAAVLLRILLDRPDSFARMIWPLAIVIAALCQSYPESISLLALGMLLFGIYRARCHELPPMQDIIKWGAMLTLVVLVFLNVSLPNVLTHMLGALGSAAKAQGLTAPTAEFGYAFTPNFLPILFGFETLREGIAEPWALALQVSALALAVMLTLFAVRRFDHYPLLISFCFAALIAFLFLSWQRSAFGTFKLMLFAQPLIFVLLAALLIELVVARNLLGVIAGFGLLLLAGRGGAAYVNQAMTPYGAIPQLAQSKLFEKIQRMVSSASNGVIIESPGFLFGRFAMLRTKERPVIFEYNFSAAFASAGLKQQVRSGPFSPWLPNQDAFAENLKRHYEDNYKSAVFQCGPPAIHAQFESLARESVPRGTPSLVPGGQLIPLNRNRYGDIDVVLLDSTDAKDFLVFRPSSLGDYYGLGDLVSVFNLERDVLTHGSIAAAGRYMLLEILSPSEEDVRLAVRFSRTYMGAQDTRLPEITLYGAQSAGLGTAGAGALSMTSPPLRPCIIGGRSYVLVDFGSEPSHFKKSAPWAYRLFDIPYLPDTRRLSGFLRDISVVSANPKDSHNKLAQLNGQWNFDAFESAFEYSGMFEDGWMSDHVILRPKSVLQRHKINIAMDIPIELAQQQAILFIKVDGKQVRQQSLSAGRVNIQIDLSASANQTISLTVDKPLLLPGGDGRSVIGLLRSITAE